MLRINILGFERILFPILCCGSWHVRQPFSFIISLSSFSVFVVGAVTWVQFSWTSRSMSSSSHCRRRIGHGMCYFFFFFFLFIPSLPF